MSYRKQQREKRSNPPVSHIAVLGFRLVSPNTEAKPDSNNRGTSIGRTAPQSICVHCPEEVEKATPIILNHSKREIAKYPIPSNKMPLSSIIGFRFIIFRHIYKENNR